MRALLIVDMQNDFMPGGPLAVPGADALVPVVNALIPKFKMVIATQDWHPQTHVSFASNHPGKKPGDIVEVHGVSQILWPAHCVQNSKGAELVVGMNVEKRFYKGTDPSIDSYSAFFDNARKKETGLRDYLQSQKIHELTIVGVATDYCVLYSVIDALDLGFSVSVVKEGCRGIDLFPGDVEAAFLQMKEKGAKII